MYNRSIINIKPLEFMWNTTNPFLFCVHHHDRYPKGNNDLGPDASLQGRNLGQDFTLKDGWRMYHGTRIPGFPAHPHRGFETVTIVLEGFVDHSDSHGAAGRYGNGDVQWMTAGAGLQHCEMFPLLSSEHDNPLELFQIWLNLPKSRKFCKPHFKMLWSKDIPIYTETDNNQKCTEITVVAGNYKNAIAPAPAPDSWAADPKNEVGIWKIKMSEMAQWVIPPASPGIRRMLYFYKGNSLKIAGIDVLPMHSVELLADEEVIVNGSHEESLLLLLQGLPINEPVAQYGPFVMNTQAEIQQAIFDFRQTEFGGWPWPTSDHVHGKSTGRFAKYPDGTTETPDF
ncbi:MAG TPA: pirin family protein [Tenuifilaceae bacterium]|nr:pirin family protein [Tenuifilaceae bacterium]